ncbi:DMT family transporter [Ancylobacter sp. 6x-1]|uniref:DMT family transporter n=1 Tax=Ancylobacter crimeensis TaxID=2579147 RepID=A0ABT0D9Q7_9HYPH|nr:DMT family transporter [Ancylobacter crimeensis]MCK0196694.1 DMT family transporter [Ancylobacter crimeensis]
MSSDSAATSGDRATSGPAPSAPALPLAGYGLALAGATLFAAKSVIVKIAYAAGIDAETLLALRMGLSLPFYLVIGLLAAGRVVRQGGRLPRGMALAKAAGVGMLGYWFSSYADFLGLTYISASFARLILFTYPLFVVLFGAVLFGLPVRRRALVAFAVAYAGLALIFAENLSVSGTDTVRGTVLVLMAAVSFALYQLCARPLIAGMGAPIFTCIAMTAAAMVALGQFLALRPVSALAVDGRMWAIGLTLALGATVLPSFLMNAALQRISAQANATIGTISPVVTMVLAVLLLGESVTGVELAGALVVVASIGWYTLADSRR